MTDDEIPAGTLAHADTVPAPPARRPYDQPGRHGPALDKASAAADRRLVGACLQGSEHAWHALVDRYRSLVYSIVLESNQSGLDSEAAFVAVWRELYARLAEPGSRADFCRWLVNLTLETCGTSPDRADGRSIDRLFEAQRLRRCLAELPAPCREVVLAQLTDSPGGSGEELAERLGVSPADWPAIRRVCLDRLRRALGRHGFL